MARMKLALTYIGAATVAGLALYGVVSLCDRFFTFSRGEKAVETVHPFVRGAASAVAEKTKEAVKETPDEKLEKESEELSRKLYPIAKGALKGHLDAIVKDADRAEVPEKMYQAGKDVSEKVVRPFAHGLAEGTGQVLKDLDNVLRQVRTFQHENKDLLDSIAKGIGSLKPGEKGQRAPLPPPLPSPEALAPPMPR